MHFPRFVAVTSFFLVLAGCANVPLTSTDGNTTPVQGAALRGTVYGGQQPIAGASVYLYAVSTAGYGNAAASLLTNAGNTSQDGNHNYYATTDGGGNFSITGDYTCPSTVSQVYLYAVGGNAGASSNSAIGLLAALGTCPANGTLSSSLTVNVNEVSTVATAYALAGYATDATHIASSASALAKTDVTNAFATVPNLETLSTGATLATTPAGNGAVPQTEINTLANILASCINSTGPSSTPCTTLLSDAKSNGSSGTTPTDTATAAINIAHNPTANVAALYALQTATAPFQTALTSVPADFTIAVSYTGGGLSNPTYVAIDGSGDAWAVNSGNNSVSELGPQGNALSGSGGYTSGLGIPYSLAIDGLGHTWVSDVGNNSVVELSSTGAALSGASGYTGSGQVDNPFGVTVDGSNNIWVANGSSLSKLNSSGTLLSTTNPGYTADNVADPFFIAIDTSGNAWTTDNGASGLSELTSTGGAVGSGGYFTNGGLNSPWGVAIDGTGNVWVANAAGASISEFNSSGTAVSTNGYTGGGLSAPWGIAIDGAGSVWVANSGGASISEFNSSGTAITSSSGYTGAGQLSAPNGVAVDGSGNVWVADANSSSMYEFVGAAAPVVTPLAANLMSPYTLHAVNKP